MKLLTCVLYCSTSLATVTAAPLPYQNPTFPLTTRVQDLLSRMSLEEKAGQLVQTNLTRLMPGNGYTRGPLDPVQLNAVLGQAHVGSVLSGGGFAPVPNTPAAWAEMTNALQRYALDSTPLRIPLLYGADGVHGHNNVLGATLFPHNIGLAASFDPALAQQVATSTGKALRATGVNWNFAPDADLGLDPRWGRFYETFGEDPQWVSALVAAQVRGFQASPLTGVAATVKHFIGYGQAADGRDRAPATVAESALNSLLVPPFRAAFQAGVASVMVNSGALNGQAVHASGDLLIGLLRRDLGFDGVTISDWDDVARLQTVHKAAASEEDAVRQAVMAGIDVMMVPTEAAAYSATVTQLVRSGKLPMARLDEAASRVLALKFRLGLFEHPFVDPAQAAAKVVDRELAYQAAGASMTLLKNAAVGGLPLLPLTVRTPRVLIVGPAASDPRAQLGGWSVDWQGVPPDTQVQAVTVLAGLKAQVPPGVTLTYQDGSSPADLQQAARGADVIVWVLGEKPGAEGQADAPTLALTDQELVRVQDLRRFGKPILTVLLAGRPLDLRTVLPASDALLMAYLPGSEGGRAVADAVWGNRNPSGRLPFRWPTRPGALPAVLTAAPDLPALFPFGAGLSYTQFAEQDLHINAAAHTARITIRNTGSSAGQHRVLAYDGSGPNRQLVAVGRVRLAAGESQTISLTWLNR
ncbi:glycoside hydrolase family 3 N-terminal domain-containing protein [Deinococcus sp. Arct2-2]|uniref:glycoside hydrolase family 3 N-terminal domain-containing protein n=1 Tax=Deinococcus sp. Arct2-2 TaxID=2568653 RepID=UPI001454BDB8|nr:glycoside hydrolase family 3 N-terminal domain-containing protein [Deinococcus sp. Arct2-2]